MSDGGTAQRTRAAGGRTSGRFPKSFIINMCLVFAGLVAVVTVTTSDVLSDTEVTRAERRIEQVGASSQPIELGTKIGQPVQPASSP